VNALNRLLTVVVLVLIGVLPAAARKKATSKTNAPKTAEVEAATRLQVFLDRANFSPGKIDGRYNEFTRKALSLYRESKGEQPQSTPPQSGRHASGAPDVSGLDLASVDPVFTSYTVTGLPPGDVYYFAVTAVNLSGAESVASNEVSASR